MMKKNGLFLLLLLSFLPSNAQEIKDILIKAYQSHDSSDS